MSQEQPRRPRAREEAIKYGDVFDVQGELASKPIPPRDAATMQAAENQVLGKTLKSGPASVMQSAATINERSGVVRHDEVTNVAEEEGVAVTKTFVGGDRVVVEVVGDQVVGQYSEPTLPMTSPASALDRDAITIGDALEASALSAGDKPVDQSDAAAIQAAEMRATRSSKVKPGGVAHEAQVAATRNTRTMRYEDKTKLSDVLQDATVKLSDDKPVTREDAEGVVAAELRNNPDMSTTPGGVAASVAAAARINQNK